MSSGAGSLTLQSNPDNPGRQKFGTYSASKTALNAITLALSIDLEDTNIKAKLDPVTGQVDLSLR